MAMAPTAPFGAAAAVPAASRPSSRVAVPRIRVPGAGRCEAREAPRCGAAETAETWRSSAPPKALLCAALGSLGLGAQLRRSRRRPRRLWTTRRRVLSLDWPKLLLPEVNNESPAGRLLHASGPVGLQQLRLAPELLQFLFEDLATEESALKQQGFESCVDHVNLPDHHYLEGYFHTLPDPGRGPAVKAANPRSGDDVAKRCAPKGLAAFAEALRRKNHQVLEELAAECPEGSQLQRSLLTRAFGDLAVQIHWGQAVEQEDVQWHVDAANSALHMAVSLHGLRTLRMKVCDPFELSSKVLDEPQRPGDVYIGNPAAYEHGLIYPAAGWEQRIVALQLRLLLTSAELRDPECLNGMALVARRIAEAPFQLPSLEEVRHAMHEISEPREAHTAA